MTRINITATDEFTGRIELLGWFDPDRATEYDEATEHDGNNRISVATGSQWEHQALYRTAGRRWVLLSWSDRQGTLPVYEFVTQDQAREWLLRNERDEAVAQHFGAIEDERGPGRPEVGNVVNVRLGDLLSAVDGYATECDITRAEAIRRLVTSGLPHAV